MLLFGIIVCQSITYLRFIRTDSKAIVALVVSRGPCDALLLRLWNPRIGTYIYRSRQF